LKLDVLKEDTHQKIQEQTENLSKRIDAQFDNLLGDLKTHLGNSVPTEE
jgi:hypothetical protein